jgi:hypothetical protein
MISDQKEKRLQVYVGIEDQAQKSLPKKKLQPFFPHSYLDGCIPLWVNEYEPSFKVQINRVPELRKDPLIIQLLHT